jgi:CheY-like chemotaxis protein
MWYPVEAFDDLTRSNLRDPSIGPRFALSISRYRNLPVSAITQSRIPANVLASDVLRQLRVLVVDDNEDAAEAMMLLLELYGHHATVVSDGISAVDAVRDGAFDLAMVDIGLPSIDGYEVARRIRKLPKSHKITLAALTGYGQDTDKRQALSAGFDEYLTKPLKIERLQELLSRLRR